jgi:beta-galactosidase
LLDGQNEKLDNGWQVSTWTEHVHADDAAVVASYGSGVLAGSPAVTRREVGAGSAWYVSAELDRADLGTLLSTITGQLGITPPLQAPPNVEVVRRRGATADYLFAINHGQTQVPLPVAGFDLTTQTAFTGALPAGAVAVIREER